MRAVVARARLRRVARLVLAQVLAAQEGAPARARVPPLARVPPRVPHQLAGRAERPAAVLDTTRLTITCCLAKFIIHRPLYAADRESIGGLRSPVG